MTDQEFIETEKRIFDIYSGILFNNQSFASGGGEAEITYDFDCPEYKTLIEKYGIDQIAGEGTAFRRAERLLHWMSPRLKHKGDYDNHIPCNALALLEYSLDNPDQGINCVNKAKILTECCLAIGIYARRVYIYPYSPYDFDNHVVTEIYDPDMEQWVMLDPSTDAYFADDAGKPLSVLELRDRFAHQQFAAMVTGGDNMEELAVLTERRAEYNAYFCKNLFYITLDSHSGFGGGYDMGLRFIPAGYHDKEARIANIEYRMRKFPEGKEFFEKWLAEVKDKPVSAPNDISLLTAPPQ